MAKPINFDESGDSADLQSLFDSISTGAAPPLPGPNHPVMSAGGGDSDDLQALFDSVSAQVESAQAGVEADTAVSAEDREPAFNRLGHMARQLHDTLQQLGYDKMLEQTAKQIPDARQRLSYIAQMTEQAASRVLNAVDIAKPIQDDILMKSQGLNGRWEKMFTNQLSVEEFKVLANDTREFFRAMPDKSKAVNEQMMEIIVAQDFQDLTGQVIKKVVEMAQTIEGELVRTLIEMVPDGRLNDAPSGLLNGPVITSVGRSDVVTDQGQVDELLESLGF